LKKIKSLLLSIIFLLSCLSGSLNPAAGSVEDLELSMDNMSFSESVIETAPLNPEFLEPEQSDSASPSSSDYGGVSGTGYTPSPVNLEGLSRPAGNFLLRASGAELPEAYDLRTEGWVTPIKSQGQSGSCWAFSSLASLESYILRTEGESRDFSENNMKNLVTKYYSDGFDLIADNGGNSFIAMAYLTRWSGPVNESADPFNETSIYSPADLPVQKHVQKVVVLPVRNNSLDNELIKRALIDYGAVFSTMCWNQVDYQDKNYSYIYTGSSSANHAITIVGWNDSFDRNRFNQVPAGNGAFIVKNSWGEKWGEEGYFYISYYDTKIGYGENAVFTSSDKDDFDYIYQYDPLGWINSIGYPDQFSVWGSNVFSSKRNEKLEAIGFYATNSNTAYEIYIYKNPTNGPLNSAKNFVAKESGTCSLPGYYTHVLNSSINLTSGEKFSVVIKFSNPSYPYLLAIEQQRANYSSKAQANSGESYTSKDGTSWQDLTMSGYSGTSLCIKAFTTVNEAPQADFSANATSWVSPLTVQFTDFSTGAFSWEWDFNGDGIIDSIARNPVYTYTSYGSYNISLNVSNRIGSDSESKTGYITITPLSFLSVNPAGNVTMYEGDRQEFNISTNHNATVNWYLNGTKKITEYGVKNTSYSNTTLSPGTYNVTVFATAGNEKVTRTWNLIILDWNPWDDLTSRSGENISTEELQEAIHVYKNGLPVPETGVELTDERLEELIRLWRESPSGR